MKEIEEFYALSRQQEQMKMKMLVHKNAQQIRQAERNLVEDKYRDQLYKVTPISIIENEIKEALHNTLPTIVGNGIASKIRDAFVHEPVFSFMKMKGVGEFKEDIKKIPNLFEYYDSVKNTINSHQQAIEVWALKIRNASNLIEADQLCNQMEIFHQKNFKLNILAQIHQVPDKMIEKINKALNPLIINVNPPVNANQGVLQSTESEVERLKRELAAEKERNKDISIDKAGLIDDKKYWKNKANKKDIKIQKLKQKLSQLSHIGNNSDESDNLNSHQSGDDSEIDIPISGANITNSD